MISLFSLTIVFALIGWKKFVCGYSTFLVLSEIKNVSLLFLKLMVMTIMSVVINYLSFIYFGLGVSMGYLEILVVSCMSLLLLWFISFINELKMFVGHLLPLGASGFLKTFTPLTEILGILIRPITLAARLATNISCGHVVLTMFSSFMLSDLVMLNLGTSVVLFILSFIESLACSTQAYVSWSLVYTYLMDIEI